MRKKYKRYTNEEKLEFITSYQTSGMYISRFEKENGLGHGRISDWMTNFGISDGNETPSYSNMKRKKPEETKDNVRERILEARIKQLEQELRDEKIKSLAYKTMIEIAEEELGVDISKKAGAKQ